MTLLTENGVPGLQVCRDKSMQPPVWEDVHHVKGSRMHRVIPTGQERNSMAFFLDPKEDYLVECLKSCCSDSSPPRFPPIRAGDYLNERFSLYMPHEPKTSKT